LILRCQHGLARCHPVRNRGAFVFCQLMHHKGQVPAAKRSPTSLPRPQHLPSCSVPCFSADQRLTADFGVFTLQHKALCGAKWPAWQPETASRFPLPASRCSTWNIFRPPLKKATSPQAKAISPLKKAIWPLIPCDSLGAV
jgi:hypothetical protein